jgi:hypothetical protein
MSPTMTQPAVAETDQPAACPPWCTTGPHAPLDCIHGTDYRNVAGAVDGGHFCGWATDPGEVGPCPDDTISATLMTVGAGPAQVYVCHGDDSLPAMTLDGAEQVAKAILGLVREARGA